MTVTGKLRVANPPDFEAEKTWRGWALTPDTFSELLRFLYYWGREMKDTFPKKGVLITLRLGKETRSEAQNRLYWKWLHIMSLHADDSGFPGADSEALHFFLKKKYLPCRIVYFESEDYFIPESTRDLTVKQFSEYLQRIEAWAHFEMDLNLPHPEDLYDRAVLWNKELRNGLEHDSEK
jgi:hypothetical protein